MSEKTKRRLLLTTSLVAILALATKFYKSEVIKTLKQDPISQGVEPKDPDIDTLSFNRIDTSAVDGHVVDGEKKEYKGMEVEITPSMILNELDEILNQQYFFHDAIGKQTFYPQTIRINNEIGIYTTRGDELIHNIHPSDLLFTEFITIEEFEDKAEDYFTSNILPILINKVETLGNEAINKQNKSKLEN